MPTPLDEIPPAEVGERLRVAREAAKLKQSDVASSLDIARTTLVAIEKGERRVRIGELQKLAQLYRTSVNALLRTEALQVDLTPQFRKLGQLNDATERAAELLSDLAKAEVELENLLGVKRVRNYPPERRILPGDVRAQAEQDALELRKWLGLGLSPVTDIITLLEMEMGVRVYVRRISGGPVSGLFAYDEAVGACILINANHPRDRRTLTAAHEMAHLISTRHQAEILGGRPVTNSREERYAASFANAFLMPARTVMQTFQEVTAGSQALTRRHVIVLAHTFGVSREAMVRRLEELGLTKKGTWEWFQQNGGITDEHAAQVLGDIPASDTQKAEADKPTTLRLGLLAGEAWRRGLLSEGQLSRMLHIDRVDLRRMFDGLEIEGSEADGALLPN